MIDGKANGLKARLAAGETLIGTFIQTPHPVVCDFLGQNFDLDFLCLEAEHSTIEAECMQSMITAADATGVPCVVRLQNNEWVPIARALDAGAQGVIAPRVNSAEEAEALVRAATYPPTGDRGIGPGRATKYGPNSGPDYRAQANEQILVAAQAETRKALAHLDEILAVPGLDLLFVGPMDLASSLGMTPNTPELNAVIEGIINRARGAGVRTGIFTVTAEATHHWVSKGVQLVLLASDLIFMAQGLGRSLSDYQALTQPATEAAPAATPAGAPGPTEVTPTADTGPRISKGVGLPLRTKRRRRD
jgi:4-hydroxy-2-oxoheptanedioate aldolase